MRAMREDWTDFEYGIFGILNEIRLSRADTAALNDQQFDPVLIKSPAQRREAEADFEQKLGIRRGIMAQLNRGK